MAQATRATTERSAVPAIRQTHLFINNELVDPLDGTCFNTLNPATGEVIASVAQGGAADIDRAVQAARRALESPPYSTMDAADRGRLLLKLADLVEAQAQELALLESLNAGKTIADSLGDMQGVANSLRYYGRMGRQDRWAYATRTRQLPHLYPASASRCGRQIIPWNFPLLMLAWKLGPAIACGNTIVLKPDEQMPLTALRLAELAMAARTARRPLSCTRE